MSTSNTRGNKLGRKNLQLRYPVTIIWLGAVIRVPFRSYPDQLRPLMKPFYPKGNGLFEDDSVPNLGSWTH